MVRLPDDGVCCYLGSPQSYSVFEIELSKKPGGSLARGERPRVGVGFFGRAATP